MLDAVLITKQPFNSANTLANEVGYAMYNNTLYYKSNSLWKKSSDNTNFNPCTVDSAYDDVDYTNLRCVDNYTTDSGAIYIISLSSGSSYSYYVSRKGINYESFYWQGVMVCHNKVPFGNANEWHSKDGSCTVNNSIYYSEAVVSHSPMDDGVTTTSYKIRKVTNVTEYKSFSEF